MKPHVLFVLIAGVTVAPEAAAQQQASPGGVAAIVPLYNRVKDLYIRSAELMPEEHYGFQPISTVRTYGQVLGHVANENYLFCSAARGEKNPNAADFEQTTSKAALVRALRESFAYCDPGYAMSETRALEEVTFFDNKGSRLWVLIFNITHDSEHYGNVVTYLRMKGLVPPSTQSGI